MHPRVKWAVALAVGASAVGGTAIAQTADKDYAAGRLVRFHAKLTGYQETPAVSTKARGTFQARVVGRRIRWTLSYRGIEGGRTLQAHIHFGQKGVAGGISAFLCTNLGNGPAGTQTCPQRRGTLSGTIRARDIVGPIPQGIDPRETNELIRAMVSGVAYANVHSTRWPLGEIRGQIKVRRR